VYEEKEKAETLAGSGLFASSRCPREAGREAVD
jgi:hypothetical protein